MPIQLTEQQQRALDSAGPTPQVVDPRTNTEYVLIPAAEYASVRDLIEDERQQRAIRAVALRNAVGRLAEGP